MRNDVFLSKDYFADDEYVVAKFAAEQRELHMHSHEFWEISYVCESKGTSHAENKPTEPIIIGEFVFVSPGASHCIVSPPSEEREWVHVCNLLIRDEYMNKIIDEIMFSHGFDEYTLAKMIYDKKSFCIKFADQSRIVLNMLVSAALEYKFSTYGSDTVMKNLVTNIFIYLTRFYEEMIAQSNVTDTKFDIIDDVVKYIKSNYGRDLRQYRIIDK